MIHKTNDIIKSIHELKESGFTVYAAEIGPKSVPLHSHKSSSGSSGGGGESKRSDGDDMWAVVMGNEDDGKVII